MKIDKATLELLKKHGFQWYKDGTTDKVEHDVIEDVVPAPGGFTVIYNDKSVLELSTAEVDKIDIPEDVDATWIRVHWNTIADDRR